VREIISSLVVTTRDVAANNRTAVEPSAVSSISMICSISASTPLLARSVSLESRRPSS
jgi:hypothetical protein